MTPELIADIKKIKGGLDNMVAPRQWKEEVKRRLERVEETLLRLQATIATREFQVTTVTALKALRDLCKLFEEYRGIKEVKRVR